VIVVIVLLSLATLLVKTGINLIRMVVNRANVTLALKSYVICTAPMVSKQTRTVAKFVSVMNVHLRLHRSSARTLVHTNVLKRPVVKLITVEDVLLITLTRTIIQFVAPSSVQNVQTVLV